MQSTKNLIHFSPSRFSILITVIIITVILVPISLVSTKEYDIFVSGTINIELKTPLVCLKDQPEHEKAVRKWIASYLHFKDSHIKTLSLECKKAVYQYNGGKILAEAAPKESRYVSLTFSPREEATSRKDCFEAVKKLIKKYNITAADKTLKEVKRRFPKEFDSPDEGPAQYLRCSEGELIDSIVMLTHEMIHRLRKEGPSDVVYFRPNGTPLKMARANQIFADVTPEMKKLVQNSGGKKNLLDNVIALYRDFSFDQILDEINAYTVSEKIALDLMKNRAGKLYNRFDVDSSTVNMFLLPIMLSWAGYQTEIIKEERPDLWEELNQPEQRETANTLWRQGIQVSNEIYNYLMENHLHIERLEEIFFKHVQSKTRGI